MKNVIFFLLLSLCFSCNESTNSFDDFKQKGFSTKNGADILFIYSPSTNRNELKKYGESRKKKDMLITIHFFNDYDQMPSKLKDMTDEKMKKYWIGTYTSLPKGVSEFSNTSKTDSSGHFEILWTNHSL